jgi:predicted SprT family Zn-dependent metalloprotease
MAHSRPPSTAPAARARRGPASPDARVDLTDAAYIRTLSEAQSAGERLIDAHLHARGDALGRWKLVLGAAKFRIATCHHAKRTIRVSREYARKASESDYTDAVLHEIAHALTGLLSPGAAAHGAEWRAHALAIGCTARVRLAVDFVRSSHVLTCVNRCFEHDRHRPGFTRKRAVVCAHCLGEFVVEKRAPVVT